MEADSPPLLQMVRVCREFQKYTGNDAPIVYNIHSKYLPKFHIHPQLLANNFFQRRKIFYRKLKKIVNSIATKEELLEYLEDDEVSFMLHHFGIQTVIEKLKTYKKEVIQKKLDINYDFNIDINNNDHHQIKHRIRSKQSFKEKMANPITFILFCFVRIHILQKTSSKTINMIATMCDFMFLLGVNARRCTAKVYEMLCHHSLSQLQKKLKAIKNIDVNHSDYYLLNRKHYISMCNELQSWTRNGINGICEIAENYREQGIKLVAQHFFNYYSCKLCHYPHIHTNNNYNNPGVGILTSSFITSLSVSNKHHIAKSIGVIKVCINNDLISRVHELNVLSVGSRRRGEIFIAMRMLRAALKLSSGYIEDDVFDKDSYIELIDDLNNDWWRTKCNYCKVKGSNKNSKHKACTGCMKVAYCSRKCQKMDWNTKHKQLCDMSWQSIYGALKLSVLDRI